MSRIEPPSGAADMSRAAHLSNLFVGWASVTGTPGEAEFSARLRATLLESPAFAGDAGCVRTIDSHGSPMTSSVAALVRGRGRRCVVLAGHFDVVSIANYENLTGLAFDPSALTDALVVELSQRERSADEELALRDLESGAFVPGRGMLDMKSGLAAGIAALERYAADPDREGNILFVATPDEENRSRGMRTLRNALPALAKEWDLDIVAAINLDATGDWGDGSDGRSVYYGTVGKYLPFAYVVGRGTHAGYPFSGISAHLIGAEIIRAVETNPDLTDEASGERSPPPICLEAKDTRRGYDVTTPAATMVAFNWLTHRRTSRDMLADFGALVGEAMTQALLRQHANAEKFTGKSRGDAPKGRVLTYAELKAEAFARGGKDAERRFDALAASLRGDDSPISVSRALVQSLVAEAKIDAPAVVIGLGSLVYPFTHVDTAEAGQQAFRTTVERCLDAMAQHHHTTFRRYEFFSGISDMSFLGHRPDRAETELIAANTPSPDFVDLAPDGLLSFPAVNIGPYGRDMHQKHERVHAHYAFEVLPGVVYEVAVACLVTGS